MGYKAIFEFSSSVRQLLNMALKISIFALDQHTIHQILSFSKSNMLILTIEGSELEMLILTESFSTL